MPHVVGEVLFSELPMLTLRAPRKILLPISVYADLPLLQYCSVTLPKVLIFNIKSGSMYEENGFKSFFETVRSEKCLDTKSDITLLLKDSLVCTQNKIWHFFVFLPFHLIPLCLQFYPPVEPNSYRLLKELQLYPGHCPGDEITPRQAHQLIHLCQIFTFLASSAASLSPGPRTRQRSQRQGEWRQTITGAPGKDFPS